MLKKLFASFSLIMLLIVVSNLSISVHAENDIPDIIEISPNNLNKCD